MEFTVTFLDQPATKESLTITKKIGEGKFNVYHAHCPSQKADYALKVFPKDAFGATQYRKELILANLSHSNIIKSIPANIESDQASDFHVMLTEFARYGDFFELVVGGIFNSETLIRTYFHQLIAGLEYMHSQGVAHLDLKLENLMMGSGFNLKIIDFDQAQRTTDKKMTSGGTKAYRAPEILDSSCTNFTAADVYSAGIILYAFKAREYPFAEVTTNKSISLKYYSTFLRNNEAFWEMKSNLKKDSSFFDESFKELVNGMLEYNVERRFTLEDIKKSKWYNGPVLNEKLLRSEMRARWENFKGGKSC